MIHKTVLKSFGFVIICIMQAPVPSTDHIKLVMVYFKVKIDYMGINSVPNGWVIAQCDKVLARGCRSKSR